MRETIEGLFDLSDRDSKRRLLTAIGAAQGWHEVELKPRRPTRSLKQNNYFHGVVLMGFVDYQNAQEVKRTTAKKAKEFFRKMFLAEDMIDANTGEILGETFLSTADLSTVEFMDFVERCRVWMETTIGVIVPDPDPEYWQHREEAKEAVGAI